jgi:ribosomal protein S18 acetylase RimI-like enzyme
MLLARPLGRKNILKIRKAEKKDIPSMCSFDEFTQLEEQTALIERWVYSGVAYVAVQDQQVVGFVTLEYNFYNLGFISMLYINPGNRRNGIGEVLVQHVESLCKTEKLFTSTNESNLPMQALLKKLSYLPSGVIDNLDEGDPELVYFKRLK